MEKLDLEREELIVILNEIINSGDIFVQHKLFLKVDEMLIREGFKSKINYWGDLSLKQMRNLD
ncbi:MAG: hypothetical protein ACTSWY_08025 [Promethearchaeota archaeon]